MDCQMTSRVVAVRCGSCDACSEMRFRGMSGIRLPSGHPCVENLFFCCAQPLAEATRASLVRRMRTICSKSAAAAHWSTKTAKHWQRTRRRMCEEAREGGRRWEWRGMRR
eukprot:9496693-Pyramimonas_sp.AAC.1